MKKDSLFIIIINNVIFLHSSKERIKSVISVKNILQAR